MPTKRNNGGVLQPYNKDTGKYGFKKASNTVKRVTISKVKK